MDTATETKKTAPKEGPPGRDGLVTRAELSRFFAVSQRQITRWEKDGMPVARKAGPGTRSLFDAARCKEWKDAQDALGADSNLSLEKARARLATAQAEKVERENRAAAAELVPVSSMIELGQVFVKAITAKVRAIPRRLVQIGAIHRDNEAAAHAVVREVLTEIADWRGIKDLERAAKDSESKPRNAGRKQPAQRVEANVTHGHDL